MDKMKWIRWQGTSYVLRCEKTDHHFAWVQSYPDGYRVQLWNDQSDPCGDWDTIAFVDDLDTAKAIAKLNVHGELV